MKKKSTKTSPRKSASRKTVLVDLALQGGGSHGAFTWGVLDRLLEESWLQFEGVSGTSAGAMNAAVLVDGYAAGGRKGAQAALEWGLSHIETNEIIAFTASTNLASQAVMRRIGMTPDPARDFDHPRLAQDHPLRRHVVFAAGRGRG